MPTLDTAKVIAAMEQDAAFVSLIPEGEVRELYRNLIRQLPDVLGETLDLPVTAERFMDVKLAVLSHIVETGLLNKIARAMPRAVLQRVGATSEMLAAKLKEASHATLLKLRGITFDFDSFLDQMQVTEDEFMASPNGGALSGDLLVEYRAGTLTVASLLERQPTAILKSN